MLIRRPRLLWEKYDIIELQDSSVNSEECNEKKKDTKRTDIKR